MQADLIRMLPNVEDIRITGSTYPTPPLRAVVGHLCTIAFLVALGVAIGGAQLPFLSPNIKQVIQQRRGAIIGAGFLLNMIGSSLLQTGAYEVILDGEVIFSKLSQGAVPSSDQIYHMVVEKTLLTKYGS